MLPSYKIDFCKSLFLLETIAGKAQPVFCYKFMEATQQHQMNRTFSSTSAASLSFGGGVSGGISVDSSVFVGRALEMSVLERKLHLVNQQRLRRMSREEELIIPPSVTVLYGPAGSGKSRLLQQFIFRMMPEPTTPGRMSGGRTDKTLLRKLQSQRQLTLNSIERKPGEPPLLICMSNNIQTGPPFSSLDAVLTRLMLGWKRMSKFEGEKTEMVYGILSQVELQDSAWCLNMALKTEFIEPQDGRISKEEASNRCVDLLVFLFEWLVARYFELDGYLLLCFENAQRLDEWSTKFLSRFLNHRSVSDGLPRLFLLQHVAMLICVFACVC